MLSQRAGPFSPDLMVLCAASLRCRPHLADCPISEVPDDALLLILLDGTGRMTGQEYLNNAFRYETTMELVEIGRCAHEIMVNTVAPPNADGKTYTGVLCLGCETNESGVLENRGTVLVLNTGALSVKVSRLVIW